MMQMTMDDNGVWTSGLEIHPCYQNIYGGVHPVPRYQVQIHSETPWVLINPDD